VSCDDPSGVARQISSFHINTAPEKWK